MAGMDDVEIAAQRFGVDDFDGREFAFSEFVGDGDLRKKAEAKFALDHALGGLDGFHFKDNVGKKAGTAEEALTEGPIAGAAIVEDERPGLDLLEAGAWVRDVGVFGMAYEYERVVAKGHSFDFGMIERARDTDISIAVEDHFEDLSGSSRADGDHSFGIGGLVVLDYVGEKISADRKGSGDIERTAGGRLEFVDGLAGEGDGAEELFGMRAKGLTCR